ncbi:MAG: hypothetical protein ABR902_07480 [Candidatus Korobacteraceae bacterium]|jgi:hypothetical protein
MPRRVRTTKSLARRMDLQYFTRSHPLRRWRLYLSLAIPVIAVVWFLSQRATGQKVYSSGPLSASHAVFGKRCEVCHVTQAGVFRREVSDHACERCHDAPAHHPHKAAFTPACASCHQEHQGSLRLARTSDNSCAQCHTNLRVRAGEPKYVATIQGFDRHHPEFAVLRPGGSDPGMIKLNHYAHLQPKLASPNGPVQMTCHDCHRPAGVEGTWPYALGQVKTVSAMTDTDRRTANPRAYMARIRYTEQCAGCHIKDLQFDKRFDEAAPHDKPEVVQAFLIKKYTEYIAAHPGAVSEPLPAGRIVTSTMAPMPPAPRTREEWIEWQVAHADRLLFSKGCKLCHTMIRENGPLPAVAKSAIPMRWLQHADFDHDSHRMLTCTTCHSAAPQSRQTADILLPGIASCRGCHQEGGPEHDAADGRCSECHQYHEWRAEQFPKSNFTIRQLRGAAGGL